MTKKIIPATRPALAAVLILAAAALAAPKPPDARTASVVPAQTPAATVLEYKMPEGRTLSYKTSEESVESTEVMGQAMESHTTSTGTFAIKAKGLKEKNFVLGVTLDDQKMTVTGPQGDMSPDMASLKGKTFDMVLSPLGSEVDVSAAEAITYEFVTGPRSVATGFKLFFPDLAGKPVKIGDSWPSTAGTVEKSGGLEIRISLENVNTLEGFETVDGMECARIRTQAVATISGTGNQQGMDMVFAGSGKGTDVWYFAVKEGIYVKSNSELTMQMSIEVPSAGMTIPATQTRKGETKLLGTK